MFFIEEAKPVIEKAKPGFFLGKKGETNCDGGVPVTDVATCQTGCTELTVPFGKKFIEGNLCFVARNGKGKCCQGGRNGRNARLVCKKQRKYIFRHSKINFIKREIIRNI